MISKLTITASNRDRFDPNTNLTKWFVKSLQWQTYKDFEILIADGGSNNYEEIKKYIEEFKGDIPMRIVQCKIGEAFERARLNNVGVRNALGEYVMTTDVDMLFGKDFVKTVMENVGKNILVESRTMYLKGNLTKRIYNGELDPYNYLDSIKKGRLKKTTTAGGSQTMHIDGWNKVCGFDEAGYVGWGSEDVDLLNRCKYAGMKVKWLGGSIEEIMLFHQQHSKPNLKKDLEYQKNNQKTLMKLQKERYYRVNPNGWGGKYN